MPVLAARSCLSLRAFSTWPCPLISAQRIVQLAPFGIGALSGFWFATAAFCPPRFAAAGSPREPVSSFGGLFSPHDAAPVISASANNATVQRMGVFHIRGGILPDGQGDVAMPA